MVQEKWLQLKLKFLFSGMIEPLVVVGIKNLVERDAMERIFSGGERSKFLANVWNPPIPPVGKTLVGGDGDCFALGRGVKCIAYQSGRAVYLEGVTKG